MSGLSRQHRAALAGRAPERPPVEICDDHAGAVLADAIEHAGEPLGVGGRRAVVVAHVQVHERRAGLERLVRRLDLLGHA